ncbi:MAG: excinuclease ABC subunit UvrC [Patescibacteria group bacterium]|nr:excinuclease ABC subunit UvrC [Patescibacteria group bacterium]
MLNIALSVNNTAGIIEYYRIEVLPLPNNPKSYIISNMNSHLKTNKLPSKTGIYKFLNQKGNILYIGKALNLKYRVQSYFKTDFPDRPWLKQMIPQIHDIETIQTENEIEALILESNLIKKYRPKYNTELKDGKQYAWILIDTRASFPKVRRTRGLKAKGRHFGPYPDGRPINRMLKYLRHLYPHANCKLKFYPDRDPAKVKTKRVCLYYHLGQCPGPCDNLMSSTEYKKNIDNIVKTLQGKKQGHIKKLEKNMLSLSQNRKFEKAAVLRDKISDLRYLSQRIDITPGDTEQEYRQIRKLRNLAGIKQAIKLLNLNIPEFRINNLRIECYDISNIAGQIAYGSMTVSIGPNIEKSQYRIFKIRDENAKDDTAMLKRVLKRRLRYLNPKTSHESPMQSSESFLKKPDIILLDGGKAQLTSATKIMSQSGIALIAISKGKRLKRAGIQQKDEFWIILNNKIKKINIKSPFIFQQLRDEAHRFAIKHHRKGRKLLQKKSVLDTIEGIGPKRKKILMKKFKTISKIKSATVEQISQTIKNKKVAQRIYTELNTNS